jgi:hypothetical protein
MSNENAAEVAAAKEAARAVVLAAREEREAERYNELEQIEFDRSDLEVLKEDVELTLDNLKSSIQFATDETERDTMMEELADAKLQVRDIEQQIQDKHTLYEETKDIHYQERTADFEADAASEEKDRKDREFNE